MICWVCYIYMPWQAAHSISRRALDGSWYLDDLLSSWSLGDILSWWCLDDSLASRSLGFSASSRRFVQFRRRCEFVMFCWVRDIYLNYWQSAHSVSRRAFEGSWHLDDSIEYVMLGWFVELVMFRWFVGKPLTRSLDTSSKVRDIEMACSWFFSDLVGMTFAWIIGQPLIQFFDEPSTVRDI